MFCKVSVLFYIVDAPVGKPRIHPSYLNKNHNEEVTFKCEIGSAVNGNPKCKKYIWNKVENNDDTFPRTIKDSNIMNLLFEGKHEGRYQCTCENDYGQSEISDMAALWSLNLTDASMLH